MQAFFFGPVLERGRNLQPVIGDQRPLLIGRFAQKIGRYLSYKVAALPLRQRGDDDLAFAAAQAGGHAGRNLFVEQKFEHD